MASARALASASSRSRFMVMPSVGRSSSRSRASAADFATCAVEIISNALATGGIGPRGAFGRLRPAAQHRRAAAPAGDQADADLDQADVGLGVRLHRVAVEQHLAAAAERHAGGRADHREGRVAHGAHGLLPALDHALDLAPGADVGGEQREADVGADGEVVRPRCGPRAPGRRPSCPSPRPCRSAPRMSGSSAFILLWNSRQATPSPMSHRLAPSRSSPAAATGSLMSESSSTPVGPRHVAVLAVRAEHLPARRPGRGRRAARPPSASSGGTGRPASRSAAASQPGPSRSISSNGPHFQA